MSVNVAGLNGQKIQDVLNHYGNDSGRIAQALVDGSASFDAIYLVAAYVMITNQLPAVMTEAGLPNPEDLAEKEHLWDAEFVTSLKKLGDLYTNTQGSIQSYLGLLESHGYYDPDSIETLVAEFQNELEAARRDVAQNPGLSTDDPVAVEDFIAWTGNYHLMPFAYSTNLKKNLFPELSLLSEKADELSFEYQDLLDEINGLDPSDPEFSVRQMEAQAKLSMLQGNQNLIMQTQKMLTEAINFADQLSSQTISDYYSNLQRMLANW